MMQQGRAWVLGDNVDTDAIIAARYLTTTDRRRLAPHVLEDLRSDFAQQHGFGDYIVAGRNFGCGSSREHASMAIQATGVTAVVARSFARIFYRNAFNTGLLILQSPQAADGVREGDRLGLDLRRGVILNMDQQTEYPVLPLDPFLARLAAKGGLIARVRRELGT